MATHNGTPITEEQRLADIDENRDYVEKDDKAYRAHVDEILSHLRDLATEIEMLTEQDGPRLTQATTLMSKLDWRLHRIHTDQLVTQAAKVDASQALVDRMERNPDADYYNLR